MATTCASLFVLQRRDRPRDASVVNANAPDPATTTTLIVIVIGLFYVKYDEMNEMLQVGVRKDVRLDHITNVCFLSHARVELPTLY